MKVLLAALVAAGMLSLAAAAAPQDSANGEKPKGVSKAMHELPPLPYAYNALEPYYDEDTVRIHHDKHHAAYVAGLNNAEDKLAAARQAGDYALVQHWERQLAFHASGDLLHSLFWQNMAPGGSPDPTGPLADQINKDFGSLDAFKKQFTAIAAGVEGNGWAVLGWSPGFAKLYIVQVENHQKQTVIDLQALLVLDMWEHAYYLKHQNRRPEWIEAWWHIVNWPDVGKRFVARK